MPKAKQRLRKQNRGLYEGATGMIEETKMETREIREKIRQDWLQKPNLSETELEYLNNYFYDDDYYYCEECDMIDSNDNWFWYDDDEYTDYLHVRGNKDK